MLLEEKKQRRTETWDMKFLKRREKKFSTAKEKSSVRVQTFDKDMN